ncbi:MAG TPA: GTP 3',8-cyclase MoaA [Candidatus Bathyarchaeia archaeon]|nr:GTP 3',8-cyclase MoaA [Candidatus Bathyarchaeia archaeon]
MIELKDSFGRVARKLRISVTDRCNFRCQFCMPKTPIWLPRENILSYEEIYRVVSLFAKMGISKIRLSGGEPLMRRNIERLVDLLVAVPGIRSVSMTTNGFQLAEKASALKMAGLSGVTVSLHSLKPDRFSEISGGGVFERVIEGIESAKKNEIPTKINAVIIRGCNDDEIVDLASLAFSGEITMRFIEYMPFDGERMWGMEKVVSGKEIVERISERHELIPESREHGSTARLYKFADGAGRIGVITSITEPFCSDCDRIRLSADGKIVPCLFDKAGYDLKPLLRNRSSDDEISLFLKNAIGRKTPGVETLLKQMSPLQHIRPMHTIGG